MVWLTDAVAEAAKMLKNAMSPTPIMSAAAVDAVRVGLRTAFWRARRPVTPLNRTTGAPITRLIGPGDDRPEHGHAEEREHGPAADDGQAVARGARTAR